MRKALLPMVGMLLLCGGATIALIATNARAAQDGHKPMMIALVPDTAAGRSAAAPATEGGPLSVQPGPRENRPGIRPENRPENRLDREQICRDLYAAKAGQMAFLEAKLSLDAKQAPLFARWKQASLDVAKQRENDCASENAPPRRLRGHRESVVDRMTMEEDLLKKRLADIEAERPALTALYNALTPAQRQELTRADMRRMAGRMHVMLSMMDRPGMGPMGRGPMERPMDAPMGPPEPPPPPAQ